MNNCDGITLESGTCTILEGHDKRDFKSIIRPFGSLSTLIRSTHSIGRAKCCIVYELVNSKGLSMPIWWGYRVFLAVQAFIKPSSDKNKATAILFKTKDYAFGGGFKGIDDLHRDILQHSMCRPHRAAAWNLDGQTLLLNPTFDFDIPANIKVVLEQSYFDIEHDPIFHRTSTFE
jgi:hypothetical protein